jgi:RNA polymerase sigma factor (TIGR02999 family)
MDRCKSQAEAMRRILVENARRKGRKKHGGDRQRIELDEGVAVTDPPNDLPAIDDALTRLAAQYPEMAGVVKLRYFVGLSIQKTAAVLGISVSTANRHWNFAKAWLYEDIRESGERAEK